MNFGQASFLTIIVFCAIVIASAHDSSDEKHKHRDQPGMCYSSPVNCSDACEYGCKLRPVAPADCQWFCSQPDLGHHLSAGVAIIITIMVSLVVALWSVMFCCYKSGCCQRAANRDQSPTVLPNFAISTMTHQVPVDTFPPPPTSPNGPNVNPPYDDNYKARLMAEAEQNLPSYNATNNKIDPPPQYPRY